MLNITGSTGLIALLGSPVSHSKSPAMHNAAFAALGLDFAYLAFDIKESEIKEAIDGLRLFGARGCNLTMPLKKCVIPHLDELSEAAALCGSVNTIVFDEGKAYGYTTDGIGYIDSLKAAGFDVAGKVITILGAGGAAESIIVACALANAASIRIFKRQNATFEKTVSFADKIARATSTPIAVLPMEDASSLQNTLYESNLLCNATNVGMGDDTRSLVPPEFLHKDLFVSDIIYHPAMTTLLADAKACGCRFLNGEDMLLYQGAAAFKLWTGRDMPL